MRQADVAALCCWPPRKLPATFNSAGADLTFASQLAKSWAGFAVAATWTAARLIQYNGIR